MVKKFLITLAGIIFVTPCFAVCPICIDITDTVCMAQKQACEANEQSMQMQEEMLRQQIMQQEQDMLMQQQQMMGQQFQINQKIALLPSNKWAY